MTRSQAETLAKALRLLDDQPRFGPRDRKLPFDSYSVAGELTEILKRNGYSPAAVNKMLDNLRR
jgi:hypothetical protein